MDTQFTITYQIVDAFTGEDSIVNEEYLARHHYEKSDPLRKFTRPDCLSLA